MPQARGTDRVFKEKFMNSKRIICHGVTRTGVYLDSLAIVLTLITPINDENNYES